MIDRRHFLQACAAIAGFPLAGCMAHHAASKLCPGPHSDFERVDGFAMEVWRIGPKSGPTVMLLHELPGLTDDDLALARCLFKQGLTVYTPVMFGRMGHGNSALGLVEACLPRVGGPRRFECSELSARSAMLDTLEPVCDGIAALARSPIGVIGMCLTGVLPLALLPNHVNAAVLCQPTLPFSFAKRRPVGPQLTDLALGAADLDEATSSKLPFLTMHYSKDPLSPTDRIHTIADRFGARAAIIELPGDGKHSSLAGDLHPDALADTVSYLKVRLKVEAGPRAMKVARLRGSACEITRDGDWQAV